MAFKFTTEQERFRYNSDKLRELATWVLAEPQNIWAQRCRREAGVDEPHDDSDDSFAQRVERMAQYFVLYVDNSVFARLVNAYLQSQSA